MNNDKKINPRHERPYRRGIKPAHMGRTHRDQLEIKEQDILRTERMRKNRPHRQFGNMENRGRARHQLNCMAITERPRCHFGWRTEEHIYREGEVPFTHAGFRQRTNHPLHRHEHRWQARPHWAKSDNPEGRAKHRWADEGKTETPRHRRWAMRPRHTEETRTEGRKRRYKSWNPNATENTSSETSRRRWSMRPRPADEHHRKGGEFRGQRIREHAHQTQYAQQQHPRQILREKWMLEQKLFRITRRIQRLNHQLRG